MEEKGRDHLHQFVIVCVCKGKVHVAQFVIEFAVAATKATILNMPNIIESVSKKQVHKAVTALLKYVGNQKNTSNNLLEEDDLLYLVSPFWHGSKMHGVHLYATFPPTNQYSS